MNPDDRPDFYRAWLGIFDSAREIALALEHHHYWVSPPVDGFESVEAIRARYTAAQYQRLLEHALCLACLDGNAFAPLVEQYVPEALANLSANGWSLERHPQPEADFDGAGNDPRPPEPAADALEGRDGG